MKLLNLPWLIGFGAQMHDNPADLACQKLEFAKKMLILVLQI